MRTPKFWVITVIVLLGLLLVADRGGQFVVERIVADEVQKALSTSDSPSVDIKGFPFLPQLISQKFDDVDVKVRDADAGQLEIERISAVLKGVEQAGGGARVESISGSGRISYAAATRAARNFTISYGGKKSVKISGDVRVAGQTRTASATGRPRIDGNELVIRPERVSIDGAAAPVAGLIPDIRYPLREIPRGMTIRIAPSEAGIDFSFDGENVALSSADITAAWGLWAVSPDETALRRRTAA